MMMTNPFSIPARLFFYYLYNFWEVFIGGFAVFSPLGIMRLLRWLFFVLFLLDNYNNHCKTIYYRHRGFFLLVSVIQFNSIQLVIQFRSMTNVASIECWTVWVITWSFSIETSVILDTNRWIADVAVVDIKRVDIGDHIDNITLFLNIYLDTFFFPYRV